VTLRPRTRALLWTALGGVIALQIALNVLLSTRVPRSSLVLRDRIVAALSESLDSDVAVGDLTLRVFPGVHAEGSNLTLRKRGVPADVPPLISIKSFTVDADLMGLARKHVSHVTVDGLDIEVPPGQHDAERDTARSSPSRAVGTAGERNGAWETAFVIDTLESKNARLVLIPRKAQKQPKVWDIHALTLQNIGVGQAMPFKAALTNAVPPGEIDTEGLFGPWKRDDPGTTPLRGTFDFKRADLSVFHGISGMLAARGSFGGRLQDIDIHGETETPDFTVKVSGHPFALHTKYHTIVDGTNGDTILERIDAKFLQSALVAKGSVIDAPPGVHGRTVSLDVSMDRARIEDVLYMAIRTARPMTGALTMDTRFLLPPGETDVVDRLRLDGGFSVGRVRFTSYNVQKKIDELSHRSRGRDEDDKKESVASNFHGRFRLGDGKLALPELSFSVPGSTVKVEGQYALKSETLDFDGVLQMDAKISQTTSGWKSLLLKVVDPFFKRKGGGSELPIRIRGTWDNPEFGIDMHRVFHRDRKD